MKRAIRPAAGVLVFIPVLAAQTSPWLPAPGCVELTPVFVYQSFEDIWRGRTPAHLRDSVRQHTGFVTAEVGLTRRAAVDVMTGYSEVNTSAFAGGARSDGGLIDTRVGVRTALTHGSAWRPALAFRAGGIFRGTYQPNFPFSAGTGGTGIEASFLGGQTFGESGFAVFGEAGYRHRNHGIPQDLFGSAGVNKSFRPISFGFTWRHARGLSGPDIGDRGFTYPRVREMQHALEGSVGFQRGHREGYQLFVARVVGGRNTGQAMIFGVAVSFGFRLPWRP